MKKFLMLGAVCAMAALMSGCQGMIAGHNGFATAPGGFIVSDMKGGTLIQDRHPARKFKVLGKVKAEAVTTSYLNLVSIGDASYQSMKKAALEKYRDADDIIDVELDFRHDNILGIINKVFVNLNGTAVKYLDMPAEK